jgi:hypothetical protein
MTLATWDPSNTGGWHLSNGNLIATSPGNDTMQSTFVAFGNTPIPDNAKTYFEYRSIWRSHPNGVHRRLWRARLRPR